MPFSRRTLYSVTGLFESANVKPWRQGVGQSLA